MARGRFLNKKIATSQRVNSLPVVARLLYTWMIPHLDRDGRMMGDVEQVKAIAIPYVCVANKKVKRYLELMEQATDPETGSGLIRRYQIGAHWYIQMDGFRGEQVGMAYDREAVSRIPPPPGVEPPQPEAKVPQPEPVAPEPYAELSPETVFAKEYMAELLKDFPSFTTKEIEGEIKKCVIWWSESKKKMQKPRLALHNWMVKANNQRFRNPVKVPAGAANNTGMKVKT